jgi:hypothetical protein
MNAVIPKLLFYKLNNLDFLMIIMKHILSCTPFTILPNYYVPSLLLGLTTFTSDMAFKRFTSDTSVKRESTNKNGALVIIIHNWCRCFNGGRLPSKHHVPGHDGDALRMNGTQVGVLKQSNKVSFQSLLEGKYSRALERTV